MNNETPITTDALETIRRRADVRARLPEDRAMDPTFPIDGLPGTFLDPSIVSCRFVRRHDMEAIQAKTPQGMILARAPGARPHRIYVADRPDGILRVMVSRDPDYSGGRWRLSISHVDADGRCFRLPTWDEVKRARYELVPKGHDMAILLPDDHASYINVMPFCILFVEIPKGNAE